MTDLPIVMRLRDRVAGPECRGTYDRDLLFEAADAIEALYTALEEAVGIIRAHIPMDSLGYNGMGTDEVPGHMMTWPVLEGHLHYMDAALRKVRP